MTKRRALIVVGAVVLLAAIVALAVWQRGWRERLPRLTPAEMRNIRGVR